MKVEAMLWVLVLVSLALAIVSPRYRRYGLLAVGFGIVAIVAVIALTSRGEPRSPAAAAVPAQPSSPRPSRVDFEQFHLDKLDKEDPLAKSRIATRENRFDQLRLAPGAEPGTFDGIRARLYNDSGHFTLTDYGYYLAIQDCVAAVCTTVYDQRGLAAATVPPGQARDVMIAIRAGETREMPSFKLLGVPKIILSPTDTRAIQASTTP